MANQSEVPAEYKGMTPAEILAETVKNRGAQGAEPRKVRQVWKCHLRELRTELNLTQRDVADAVLLSAAGYHQMETCGGDVCLSTAVRVSEFFGKPITEIWTKLET